MGIHLNCREDRIADHARVDGFFYCLPCCLHIIAGLQRSCAVLSVTVLERALGTALVRQYFQFSTLHLMKERQHQGKHSIL